MEEDIGIAGIILIMDFEWHPAKAAPICKTQDPRAQNELQEDLLEEYGFDYSKAKPNRFATAQTPKLRTVVLDPDVAAVFTSEEAVNTVLRALIQTMPRTPQPSLIAESSDH